ncbi:hypothetical protein ACSAZL_13285 [Methanosarcina sp. T3]|uniref:hypothetical protein n=1 Tax=Methanosarcina sp. T3 TaxID=3439062 RepID=UPI003F84E252
MNISEHNTLWENYFSSYIKVASPHRKPSLFKWLYDSYKRLYLSCVSPSDIYMLADLKACLALVDTAVDDTCDNASLIEENGGDKFSYEMLSMLYNADRVASGDYMPLQPAVGNNIYAKTTLDIFSDLLETHVVSLPRYNDFRGEFFLAMRNVAGSMEFSYLVNRNKIAYPYYLVVQNKGPSTMVEVLSILDLMASESFDASELGKAIALFKMADVVAMLNNAVNTWKKEIIERDYSSPVISLALERKLVKFSDFEEVNAKSMEENLSSLPEIINDQINSTILVMKEFVESYEIKSFDALKYINNYETYAFDSQRKNKEVCQRQTA